MPGLAMEKKAFRVTLSQSNPGNLVPITIWGDPNQPPQADLLEAWSTNARPQDTKPNSQGGTRRHHPSQAPTLTSKGGGVILGHTFPLSQFGSKAQPRLPHRPASSQSLLGYASDARAAGAHRASLSPLPRPRRAVPPSRDGGAGLAAQAQSPPRPQALCKVVCGQV